MAQFICPVCREKLEKNEKVYICKKGHSFDIAKSGYVNLLCSSKSSKKRHGDDKLMVNARTEFLNGGYYDILRNFIVQTVKEHANNTPSILEAGCGECFYLDGVVKALEKKGKNPTAIGIDISKNALTAGAKRNRGISLAVAGINKIPVADESINIVLNIFAPHDEKEFFRILQKDGILLRVIPLERHLFGLKEKIYDNPYSNKVLSPELEGFTIIKQKTVKDRIVIENKKDIDNLFKMTPYYYKTGTGDQQKVLELERLETEIEFGILVYRKGKV